MTYHKKQLNSNTPSYKQKLQFKGDMEKAKKKDKINQKKIFDDSSKKSSKKKKVSKKKY